MKTMDLTRIALLTTMVAVGAFIEIPAPVIGSFTLQLTFVILAGILLGKKNGTIAVLIYAVGGLIGIPWFAHGGGIGYVIQPTFGFILSFAAAAYISGLFREYSEKKYKKVRLNWVIAGSVISTLVVWVFGMLYLSAIYQYVLGKSFGYSKALLSIFSPSLVVDLILAVVISGVGIRIYKILNLKVKGATKI